MEKEEEEEQEEEKGKQEREEGGKDGGREEEEKAEAEDAPQVNCTSAGSQNGDKSCQRVVHHMQRACEPSHPTTLANGKPSAMMDFRKKTKRQLHRTRNSTAGPQTPPRDLEQHQITGTTPAVCCLKTLCTIVANYANVDKLSFLLSFFLSFLFFLFLLAFIFHECFQRKTTLRFSLVGKRGISRFSCGTGRWLFLLKRADFIGRTTWRPVSTSAIT